ncbi:hypothetical protein [Polaribacter sp. Hel1_85]|uniref:hypothetical protein n=1 Tax=Polaribacter sp. Hel1_85 TaxID=1250005 RepID=UPI00052C8F0D|nr:hypothetical protein [Polaribacter sp. Hel1_85]KGL64089.1 hypothetical protein PHEL85_1134 [Polaribacter sp. Hel1_85]
MKKILIVFILCSFFNLSYSQQFKNRMSSSFNKENKNDIYKIVLPSPYGFTKLHYLENVFMDNTKSMILTKYDQEMKSTDTKSFNLPKLGLRASDLQEVIELDSQLIFLSTVMDKKLGKHQVNAQVYLSKESSVSDNKILASFEIEKYSRSGFYQISISPDKSKIAIVANMPYEKKKKETVKVWVYDNQLNLLWEQKETLTYNSEKVYEEKLFVQNSGEVIMSKKTNSHKKTRKSELLIFNSNSVDIVDFSSTDFMPMQTKLIEVNGNPMLTGFFWDGKTVIIKTNQTEGVDNDGAFLFDLNTKKLLGAHKWNNTINSKDLKSLQVISVNVINDDIYLLGEKQLETSEFKKGGNSMTTEIDYFYTYGSSVLVNIDTKGTLKSFKNLFESKKYKNNEKEKGSFSSLYLEDGLRIFSNYNKKESKYRGIMVNSFFFDNQISFLKPKITIPNYNYPVVPYVLSKTIKEVKNYNILYYITNYGDRYWFNKTTW